MVTNTLAEKLLALLKGAEFDEFIEFIKPQLALQKRYGGGKNIAAIEKIVYSTPPTVRPIDIDHNPGNKSAAPTPSLIPSEGPSPQSESVPSTKPSPIQDAPIDSRKPGAASEALEVATTPTSM